MLPVCFDIMLLRLEVQVLADLLLLQLQAEVKICYRSANCRLNSIRGPLRFVVSTLASILCGCISGEVDVDDGIEACSSGANQLKCAVPVTADRLAVPNAAQL